MSRRGAVQGLALISVLFAIALIVSLAAVVVQMTRTRAVVTERQIELAQAREAADGALRLAILEIAAPADSQSAFSASGEFVRQFQLFESTVDLTADLEAGRVDINAADESLLTAVLSATGLSAQAAQCAARRIVDWRDPDDSAASCGAERAEYAAARLKYSPRNGPFESVWEVRQVLDLENLDEAALNALTVYSHAATPTASSVEAVRQAIAQLNSTARLRRDVSTDEQEASNDDGSNDPSQPGFSAQSVAGQTIRLKACTGGRTRTCRLAIVLLTGNASRPYLVFVWQTIYPDR